MQLDINYYFNMQPSASDRYFFYCARETSSILLNFSKFTTEWAREEKRFHFNPRQAIFLHRIDREIVFHGTTSAEPFTFQSGSLEARLTTETTPVQR